MEEKEQQENPVEKSNFSFDKRKVWDFCKKYSFIFFMILIVMLNFSIRMTNHELPIADEWAKNSIDSRYKEVALQNLNSKYPGLPQESINSYLESEVEALKQQVPPPSIESIANQFRENFRNEEGITYLVGIDPYFWYRHAVNVLDHGYPGDKLIDGKNYDTYRLAPIGNFLGPDEFHAYFMAFIGIIFGWFGYNLLSASYFVPIILTSLIVIPAFLIGRRLGGNIAGAVASFIALFNTPFLARTIGGFADTDPYSVLLPMLIIWAVYEAYLAKSVWGEVLWACLAGFFIGLFGFAWIGWAFALDIILASFGIYLAYLFFTKKSYKFFLRIFSTFVASSAIFIYLLRDLRSVYFGPFSFLWFIRMKDVATVKIWPSVLTTVAEQSEISFRAIIGSLGGWVFVILAISGLCLLLYEKKKFLFVLSVVWILATLYGSTKGARYVQLMLPIFAILIGYAISTIISKCSEYISNIFNTKASYFSIGMIVIVCFCFYVPYSSAKYTVSQMPPDFDDAWFQSLDKIEKESSKDAIITSWWDFGHMFKAIADRGVTFDGTTQDTPFAHWVGKVLLTDNEDQAMAIEKMIVCSGNTAYDYLVNKTGNQLDAKTELDRLLLAHDDIIVNDYDQRLLDLMRCKNVPENYFITSEDMIGKSGVWAHFGSWNFTRAQMVYDVNNGVPNNYDYADAATIRGLDNSGANSWIAPWPSYASNIGSCSSNNSIITCQNNVQGGQMIFIFDTANETLLEPEGLIPYSVTFERNGTFVSKKFNNSNTAVSLSIFPNAAGNIILSPPLAESMFNRLFFYDGLGLKHFTKFSDVRSLLNGRIIVWSVDFGSEDYE